jgi:hypothetical protein
MHMNFESLKRALEFVLDNEEKEVEWFNDATIEDVNPEVPPELEIPGKLVLSDGAREESVDISSWTQEQKDIVFKQFLDPCLESHQEGARRAYQNYPLQQLADFGFVV